MKRKKILLIMLVLLLTITLFQLNVNAVGNVSDFTGSDYDYFITETNKILTKEDLVKTENAEETIIAGIKGNYTGTINYDNVTKVININTFSANNLEIYVQTISLSVEGSNSIKKFNII